MSQCPSPFTSIYFITTINIQIQQSTFIYTILPHLCQWASPFTSIYFITTINNQIHHWTFIYTILLPHASVSQYIYMHLLYNYNKQSNSSLNVYLFYLTSTCLSVPSPFTCIYFITTINIQTQHSTFIYTILLPHFSVSQSIYMHLLYNYN